MKDGYWKGFYVCSVCGEISPRLALECPFCHSQMGIPHGTALCKLRNEDKCGMYCEGFDESCEDYTPAEDR